MTDLVILVPSRGRPGNVERLIAACEQTCTASTMIAFGFDEDDPALPANLAALRWRASASVRARMGLAPWTNELAWLHDEVPYLASLGDDMVPVTPGWDEKLIGACGEHGMAYPNDRRRDDIPEAIVMSSSIVKALGWMSLPALDHWYQDNVWRDLGESAGCLRYLPDVVVEHRHPNVHPGTPGDATYADAAGKFAADMAAYQKWRLKGMRADISKVRALCSAA